MAVHNRIHGGLRQRLVAEGAHFRDVFVQVVPLQETSVLVIAIGLGTLEGFIGIHGDLELAVLRVWIDRFFDAPPGLHRIFHSAPLQVRQKSGLPHEAGAAKVALELQVSLAMLHSKMDPEGADVRVEPTAMRAAQFRSLTATTANF